MSNYCKNCYELTEELENHKRWLNDYKQKLQDAEEFANAKITQCANLIKQLNETHEQLDQLKAENDTLFKAIEEVNKINKRLKAENERLKDIIETKLEDANICDSALNYINDEYIYVKRQLDQLKEQLEAYKMETEEGKEINAELKAENKHLNDLLNQALKELEEYREALEKVREIAEAYGHWNVNAPVSGYKQILQICDEVNDV